MSTPNKKRIRPNSENCEEQEEMLLGSPKSKNFKEDETNLDVSSNSVEGIMIDEGGEENVEAVACQSAQKEENHQLICGNNFDEDAVILADDNQAVEKQVSQECRESPWQEAMKSIPARLMYIYEHPEFADCIVQAGMGDMQKSFNVHKLLMFITSAKFKELINENSELVLPDITPGQFEILLRYIYVGVLTVKSVEEAREMYQIGVKYGIPHISLLAKTYALRHLNPQNVWALLELAAKDDNAVAECCSFISKHPLCWQNLTASVSRSTLNNILSLTCLDTPEIEIVKAVDEWVTLKCDEMGIEKNIDNKRRLVGNEILSKLRFLSLTPMEFLKFSFPDPPSSAGSDLGPVPSSFLTPTETFAILANLINPGCLPLPSEFSSLSRKRGFVKFRVNRKTDFTFLVGATQFASSYPVPNCSAGSKNFVTFMTTNKRIVLHGIQIPTYWDAPFKARSTYHEAYKIEIVDPENNLLASAFTSLDANYASFVDIFLSKSIVLEPKIPYKISLSTENTYFLLKSLREEEVHENVKFSFKDSSTPVNPTEHAPSSLHANHGFILQVIFSLGL